MKTVAAVSLLFSLFFGGLAFAGFTRADVQTLRDTVQRLVNSGCQSDDDHDVAMKLTAKIDGDKMGDFTSAEMSRLVIARAKIHEGDMRGILHKKKEKRTKECIESYQKAINNLDKILASPDAKSPNAKTIIPTSSESAK